MIGLPSVVSMNLKIFDKISNADLVKLQTVKLKFDVYVQR